LDKAKQIVTLPPEVLESTKEAADVIIRWQSVCQVEFEAAEEAAEQDDDESDDDIFDTLVFWAERISPQDDSDCD
jgi:importin-4